MTEVTAYDIFHDEESDGALSCFGNPSVHCFLPLISSFQSVNTVQFCEVAASYEPLHR